MPRFYNIYLIAVLITRLPAQKFIIRKINLSRKNIHPNCYDGNFKYNLKNNHVQSNICLKFKTDVTIYGNDVF